MKQTIKTKVKLSVIDKLMEKSLFHVLNRIFLFMTIDELRRCKQVRKSWNEFIKNIFWTTGEIKKIIESKLEKNWKDGKHKRVEVIVESIDCKCFEGFDTICQCFPDFQISDDQSRIILLKQFRRFSGRYNINDETIFFDENVFDRPRMEISLSMKDDLKVNNAQFLTNPQLKKQSLLKKSAIIKGKDLVFIIDKLDKSYLNLIRKSSKDLLHRWQPDTGWIDTVVESVSFNSGRLAVLINKKVFVYSCQNFPQADPELILKGTRQDQIPIDNYYLGKSYLVTIGRNQIVMFDFWTDETSRNSEFFK